MMTKQVEPFTSFEYSNIIRVKQMPKNGQVPANLLTSYLFGSHQMCNFRSICFITNIQAARQRVELFITGRKSVLWAK